jgi:hypothetical protein
MYKFHESLLSQCIKNVLRRLYLKINLSHAVKKKMTCTSSFFQVFVQRKLVCHQQLGSGPFFKSQAVQEDISTSQDRMHMMSWNVTNKQPRYATQHLRRTKTSFPDMLGYRSSEITAVCVWLLNTRLIMRFMKKLYSQNLQM